MPTIPFIHYNYILFEKYLLKIDLLNPIFSPQAQSTTFNVKSGLQSTDLYTDMYWKITIFIFAWYPKAILGYVWKKHDITMVNIQKAWEYRVFYVSAHIHLNVLTHVLSNFSSVISVL